MAKKYRKQTKRRGHDFVLSLVWGTSLASLCYPCGIIEINCCCSYNIIRKAGGELLSVCYASVNSSCTHAPPGLTPGH